MNGKTNVTTTSNGSGTNVPHIPPNDFIVAPGDAKTQITWTDPNDLYASPEGVISQAPYQLVSKWTSTKIVRSETDYPATPNDGILAVESNIRDEHKTTVFEDTNLNNGTVYYYSAFGMNEQGLYSQPSTQYAEVRASIPMADGYKDITTTDYCESTVVCTQNHALSFGHSGYSFFEGDPSKAMAIDVNFTETHLGNIPDTNNPLSGNGVCSLNGYGFSIGGAGKSSYYSNVYMISPTLTITNIRNAASYYTQAKGVAAASTTSHIISFGGTGKYNERTSTIYAWTLDGTGSIIDDTFSTKYLLAYGASLNGNAIFVSNDFGNDFYINSDLTKVDLSTSIPINSNVISVSELVCSANTPNHLIFITSRSQSSASSTSTAYDGDFTMTTIEALYYSTRYMAQGITMGNYAMFIGGTNGSYINSGDGPKHEELYQIQYYDISLTLNQSDSVYNELENPNPDEMWWDGVAMIIKNQYQIGGNIGDVGIIYATFSNAISPRIYRFKLA